MSFLVDPPWLALNGYLIARVSPNERVERALELATDATFLSVSIPLYLNAGWTEGIWKPTGAESGRDWMINSRVTHFEHRKPTWRTHAIAAAIFTTYPLWLRFGLRLGRRRKERDRPRRDPKNSSRTHLSQTTLGYVESIRVRRP